jgi:hypothetical protein
MVALLRPLRVESALFCFGPIKRHAVVGTTSAAGLTNFSAMDVGFLIHVALLADARRNVFLSLAFVFVEGMEIPCAQTNDVLVFFLIARAGRAWDAFLHESLWSSWT